MTTMASMTEPDRRDPATATAPDRHPGGLRMASLDTRLGPLWLLADGEVLTACWFGDPTGMLDRVAPDVPERVDHLGSISAAVAAYFEGDLTAFDELPTRQPGSEFRQACWKAMRAVPAGETITYRELAIAAGHPNAVRAAGSACATNAIAVVVPCHRIVSSSGGLGGYAYGLGTKQWLLAHERGQSSL